MYEAIKKRKTTNLKLILRLEPRLARLEPTPEAGTVSDRCIPLPLSGGLPSNVAERCTDDLNRTGSSVGIEEGTGFSGGTGSDLGGVAGRAGCSRAPRGSFDVTGVLGETLRNNRYQNEVVKF